MSERDRKPGTEEQTLDGVLPLGSRTEPRPAQTIAAPNQTMRLPPGALGLSLQAPTRMATLLVIAGTPADIGTNVAVTDEVVIGREGGLQLRDGGISRRHAQVTRRDTVYVVSDLGSTNGTLVNGQRIEGEVELQEGDKIYVGQSVLKFHLVDETEAAYLTEVQRLVGTDELTGLVAKHRFDAALAEAVRQALLSARPLSLLMLDMDGLKPINDRYGHQVGADTIRQVGILIGQLLKTRGEACRFGGDEFSIFLPGVDLPLAMIIGDELRTAVQQLEIASGPLRLRVTISVGAAQLGRATAGTEVETLVRAADAALYRAKAAGRNCVSA